MTKNRSVPTDTVLPHIAYPDVAEAAAWLGRVFGFVEQYRCGGPVSGVQVSAGRATIQLRNARGGKSPAQLGYGTQSLTVFVDDVGAHFARSKAEGARIVEELHETVYGEQQYGVEYLDGHHWLFSQHARDVAPEEWGAVVVRNPAS
jgi:uncharacterized glyoxalase superfamily protein PhnB